MPSANGVYSLPVGYLAVTGQTIQASQHNPPLEDIAAALTGRLSRDGTAPMTGPVKAADGAVGSPSVTFANAPTTGLYKTMSGNIGVAVGGSEVAEFGSGGIVKGSRLIGELIPWTFSTAPPLWVLCFGQTLSRTTYADLWALAQIEIANGLTLFNNGDGSTTFGVPDMRGRVPAGKDDMGGSSAFRLTSAVMTPDGQHLGATGGAQNKTLVTANLPAYTPSGSVAGTVPIQGAYAIGGFVSGSVITTAAAEGINNGGATSLPFNAAIFTGSAQGGTSTPFPTMGPAIITNYILFAGA
jgi:microcystin-dependent protein